MKIGNSNKIEPKMDMSSMTDIVFLLLIFFMTLSTFDQSSSAISVDLPNSTKSDKVVSHIAVSINKDLEYTVGTTKVKDFSQVDVEVRKAMEKTSQNNIHLYADKDVPIGEITKMYILADKLEATISLGVDPI